LVNRNWSTHSSIVFMWLTPISAKPGHNFHGPLISWHCFLYLASWSLIMHFLNDITRDQQFTKVKSDRQSSRVFFQKKLICQWRIQGGALGASAPLSKKSSTYINIRFSRLFNVTVWLLIEWFSICVMKVKQNTN
jgi:hypothetical protein